MRTLIVFFLLCSTCYAWEASSTEIQDVEYPYELRGGGEILGYYDGLVELADEAAYIVACDAYDDSQKDFDNWRDRDKAMMSAMYDILVYLGYPETKQQFKQRIKNKM